MPKQSAYEKAFEAASKNKPPALPSKAPTKPAAGKKKPC